MINKVLFDEIDQKSISDLKDPTYENLMRIAIDYSDGIIIGSENLEKSQIIANLYKELESEIIFTDPISSQLIKYLSNAYLPLRLSFVNEASRLIDSLNANQSDVLKGVGLDSRIGDQYFRPSPGWGGSCFPKDVIEIQQIAKENNLDLPVIQSISNSNSEHLLWFSKKLKEIMNINDLQKNKVMEFKKDYNLNDFSIYTRKLYDKYVRS